MQRVTLMFYISSRGDYARESHRGLPSKQKTLGSGKFLLEKYVHPVETVEENTVYVCAAPIILLLTTCDCSGG